MPRRKLKETQVSIRLTKSQMAKLNRWTTEKEMSRGDFIGMMLMGLPEPGSKNIDADMLQGVITLLERTEEQEQGGLDLE